MEHLFITGRGLARERRRPRRKRRTAGHVCRRYGQRSRALYAVMQIMSLEILPSRSVPAVIPSILAILFGAAIVAPGAAIQRTRAKQVDTIVERILGLWEDADVVALGENHGSRLDSEVRLALVRHPRFVEVVDFVVVEFANGHRQDLLDQYIAGETVPRSELVTVWRDTGYETWDSPIYEAFLAALREANAKVPNERKVRVIAGDVPIDWKSMASGRELLQYSDRGDYPTHLVDCQILAQGRKGLLVYGALHVLHGPGDSFVTTLDQKYPGRVRTLIGALWPEETMARLRSTLGLGAEPALILLRDGEKRELDEVSEWDFWSLDGFRGRPPLPLSEAVDGLIYYGDEGDEIVAIDRTTDDDAAYRSQRAHRDLLRAEFAQIVEAEGWAGVRQYDDYTCE